MTSLRTVFSRGASRALGVLAISLLGGRLGAMRRRRRRGAPAPARRAAPPTGAPARAR